METRHKGVNHTCRFIYLLDLIKNNSSIFSDMAIPDQDISRNMNLVSNSIMKYYLPSYMIYFYIDGKNIYKKIKIGYIIKAFESVIRRMYGTKMPITLGEELNNINATELGHLSEDEVYDMLSRFFDLNSSPFRHFIMNSSETINFLNIPDENIPDENIPNNDIETYRERMNELKQQLDDATTDDEKNVIKDQIKQLETEFNDTLPFMAVNENTLKGGKRNRKSNKKYRNKIKGRKYKNTKKRRRN